MIAYRHRCYGHIHRMSCTLGHGFMYKCTELANSDLTHPGMHSCSAKHGAKAPWCNASINCGKHKVKKHPKASFSRLLASKQVSISVISASSPVCKANNMVDTHTMASVSCGARFLWWLFCKAKAKNFCLSTSPAGDHVASNRYMLS